MQSSVRVPSRSRQLRIVLGVLALALAVWACGSSTANTGTKSSGNSTSTPSGGSKSGNQHFKVGDQVNVGNTYTVTVNSVKTSAGDDVFQPKTGNTFLIVDVTLKNTSSKEQDLSSILQFTLKDSTGQKYDETVVSNATPPDGKLAAGDTVRGQLAYEVPASMHDFTLAFEADITSSGQTIWDLHV